MKNCDLLVIGGGPGGYVAAIRAAQEGKKVILIEKDKMGGVCLNRGCIPTKAILKSAHSVHELENLQSLGINFNKSSVSLDASVAIRRAHSISSRISKGVSFLMKKHKIEIIRANAILERRDEITKSFIVNLANLENISNAAEQVAANNIIIATGAHYKTFPGLEHNGKNIIGAYEALEMEEMPKRIAIIGAGAIGVEFAYFWNSFGVEVHIFELQDHVLPLEDTESSIAVEKAYKKYGIQLHLGLNKVSVQEVENNDSSVSVSYQKNKDDRDSEKMLFDKCLIAVGMTGNIDNLGLENLSIKTNRGFIEIDSMNQTNIEGIYAIGDVSGPPLLAHVASHQGIIAVEHLCNLNPHPMVKINIPGCTYCQPQVASIGLTEEALKRDKIVYKVGKVPFVANGKAIASNQKEGFIKTLIGEYGEILGVHIVGAEATELIHEYILLKHMEGTSEDITTAIHPHPTLGEFLPEAVLNAEGKSINC